MNWYRARAASPDVLFAEGAIAVEPDGESFCGHFLSADHAAAAGPAEQIAPPEWAAEWLAQQRSALVTPRLFVTSSAAPQPAPPGARALLLEPGLAFGDGHHATTRLCLRALDEELRRRPGARVLDAGTGTGVLAIAAVLLGASRAVGTDIDPLALRSARRNAIRNHVIIDFQMELPAAIFDLILANVPEEAHAALAPGLAACLAPGGTIIASGFAAGRRSLVEAIYPLTVADRTEESAWSALRFVR